jgi:hypothetical protein
LLADLTESPTSTILLHIAQVNKPFTVSSSRGRIDAAAGAIASPSREVGVEVWTLLTCFLTFRLFRPFFPGEHSTDVAVKTSRAKRMKSISEEIENSQLGSFERRSLRQHGAKLAQRGQNC